MRQASYALVALLVPFVGWYLLAPAAVLFGWTRRAFMRFCSWVLLLLAVLSASGDVHRSPSQRVAWGAAWLVAAAIGFRLSGSPGAHLRGPRPLARLWHRRTAALAALRPDRDPHQLIVLCERRIGKPVDAAARLRVTDARGDAHPRARAGRRLPVVDRASALERAHIGPICLYRPLQGLAAHTECRRGGRHLVELSWPASGELFLGTLHGPGADRLSGQLAAEQFARAQVGVPASGEGR